MRLPLQRRLFFYFGLCIVVTAAVVGVISAALSAGTGSVWQRQFEEGKSFVAGRFAESWEDPVKLAALAAEISGGFDVRVTVLDAAGVARLTAGPECQGRHNISAPVLREGQRLGTIDVCTPSRPSRPLRFLLPLFAALAVLWMLSHKFAHNLARPLVELERVAKALGEGKLDARVSTGPHVRGEARVVAAAMNEMAERIEKQLRDQRELLAAVSHELRTPLARMRVLLELARDGQGEKHFDELDREVVEVDDLVGELLANARVDFSALRLTEVDAVDQAVRALERQNLPPERLSVEGTPRRFPADATLLSRALANLLDNAGKHGGGAQALKVEFTETSVRFAVEDRGAGFAEGDEQRAFDPFYKRASTAAAEARSLGLGLSLVRRIAEAHRGQATAANLPGGGARVQLELPLS